MENINFEDLPSPPTTPRGSSSGSAAAPLTLQPPCVTQGAIGEEMQCAEAVAEAKMVEEAQRKALEVITAFRDQLTGGLVEESLRKSSEMVSAVLQELTTAHTRDMERVSLENTQLRMQLEKTAAMVDELTQQLGSAPPPSQLTQAGASAASSQNSVVQPSNMSAMETLAAMGGASHDTYGASDLGSAHTGWERAATHAATMDATAPGPFTEPLECSRHLRADPRAIAGLIASNVRAQALIRALQEDRAQWRDRAREWHGLLQDVVQENAQYRREVAQLRVTTAPLTRYRDAVQVRDTALYELKALRLEAAKLAQQLSMAHSQCAVDEALSSATVAAEAAASRHDNHPHPHAAATGGGDDGGRGEEGEGTSLRHEGMWGLALRELEEQATLAATHRAAGERLAEAEVRLEDLAKRRDALQGVADTLQKENQELRLDAQTLTYRNSVLSQQLVSLLVKVERLQKEHNSSSGDSRLEAASRRHRGSEWGEGSDVRLRRSIAAAPLAPSARQRDGAVAAAAATEMLRQRLCAPREAGGERTSLSSASSCGSCLPGTKRARGVPPAANATLPPALATFPSPSASLVIPAALSLDVSLRDPADSTGAAELLAVPDAMLVERGLERTLSTYAITRHTPGLTTSPLLQQQQEQQQQRQRRRRVLMRGFGVGTVSPEKSSCDVHLPACDQLSGVALGRPSSYAILDSRRGSVTRQFTAAERAWVYSAGIAAPSQSPPAADGLFSLVSASGSADCADLLSMLAMLDADEQLDRYSVNTVSELVVRNQELLQQLYRATQRAETAESQLQCILARDSAPADTDRAAALTTDGNVNELLRLPSAPLARESIPNPPLNAYVTDTARKRARADPRSTAPEPFPLVGAAWRADDAAAPPGVALTGSSSFTTRLSTASLRRDDAAGSPPGRGDGGGGGDPDFMALSASPAAAAASADVLSTDMQKTVEKLAHAVLLRHEAESAVRGEGLAAAFLRVMRAQNAAAAAAMKGARIKAAAGEDALTHSLVELCTSQAVALAQQAVTLAHSHQVAGAQTHRAGWQAAQKLLRQTVRELKHLLRARSPGCPQPLEETTTPQDAAAPPSFDEAALLERVAQLLRTAADKDGTVQLACAAAHSRQRLFLRQHENKLRRLIVKSRRAAGDAAAAAAHLKQRSTATAISSPAVMASAVTGFTTAVEREVASLERLPAPAVRCGSTCSSTRAEEDAGLGDAPRQLGLSTPVVTRTRALAEEEQIEEAEQEQEEEEEDSLETAPYSQLREQLALEQATLATLTEELQSERATHIELYTRMWQLEVERDDAVAAQRRVEEHVQSMWTREQYEGMVAELDVAKAAIKDRDAQLAYIHQEASRLQREVDRQVEQSRAATAEFQAAMQQKDLQLAKQVQRIAQLERAAVGHAQDAETHARDVAHRDACIAELEGRLGDLKRAFLSAEQTQETLRRLYPGDTVLAAHAKLLQTLQAEQQEREAHVQQLLVQLRGAEAALAQADVGTRRAVQERQSAETRLQEMFFALSREPPEQRPCGPSPVAEAAPADEPDAVLSGRVAPRPDATSLWELETRVEVQAREIQRLQQSEAAWKLREAQYRVQLEAMGRDPISAAVRRYGLKTTTGFEAMMLEMQERAEALQTRVDALNTTKAELEASASAVASDLRVAAERNDALQRTLDETTTSQEALRRENERLHAALADRQGDLEVREAALARLQEDLSKLYKGNDQLQRDLAQCTEERNKFYSDNKALIDKVGELAQELVQVSNAKKASDATLAHNLRTAVPSAGRRRRRADSGRRGESRTSALRGCVSLTADLTDARTPSPLPPVPNEPPHEA